MRSGILVGLGAAFFHFATCTHLIGASWSNCPSGQTNPTTLPAAGQTKFFRLFKP